MGKKLSTAIIWRCFEHMIYSEECYMTDVMTAIVHKQVGVAARSASRKLAIATADPKNAALHAIADALDANADRILAANQLDLADGKTNGLSAALLDRLSLQNRLGAIAQDVREVASLPDPVGEVFDASVLPNGLKISKRRPPIGVLGGVYEARPNVTVDVAALAIKTCNAAILRGGSEMLRSAGELAGVIPETAGRCGVPA